MDRSQYNSTDHTHSSGHSFSNRGYKARRKEETPSKMRKEVTPDGKHDNDRRRTNGSSSKLSNGGKQKANTPTKPHSSVSSPVSMSSDGGLTSNGSSSRYHHRDVPPRFQLYGNKHSANKQHSSNSSCKNPHSSTSSKSLHSKSTQSQGNKKSRDGNNHWSSVAGHSTDNTWCHTPDNESMPPPSSSLGGKRDSSRLHSHSNPWGNIAPQDGSNWTSEEECINSDPLGEEAASTNSDPDKYSVDRRGDGGSDFDEQDVETQSSFSDSHQIGIRLRNSDSDAMKDGVSSSHIKDLHDDTIDVSSLNEGGGLWRGHMSRSSMGSSSSVNSAGSNSSWKGGSNGSRSNNTNNGSGFQRSASPRKHRYENHRSLSTSGKPVSSSKYSAKTPSKKHSSDLDDALDSLHGEPSGWGDLPSPKPSEVDTGTEVWGIPDDLKQKMKKDTKSMGTGWTESNRGDEWGGGTPTGWGGQNYSKGLGSNGPGIQWSTNDQSWKNMVKGKEKSTGFSENVKILIDMGFSVADSEEILKQNNNNFDAALGDLLALASIKEDDIPPDLSPSNFPLPGPVPRGLQPGRNPSNRLSPSSLSHSSGPSPRTTSPAFVHVTKDQLPSHISSAGSTPATPTIPAASNQNHLFSSAFQQQSQVMPPSKLPRSVSAPHGDSSEINTHYVQKVLLQQLRDYQLVKQQLINQMKSPQSPKHQQITLKLNQVNTSILLVQHHLHLADELAVQQRQQQQHKSAAATPGAIEGMGPVGSTKDLGTPTSVTLSPPEVFGLESQNPPDANHLSYSMHSMTLSESETTASVSQSSARSISKLQQIISGGNEDPKAASTFSDIAVFEDEQQQQQKQSSFTNRSIPMPIGLPPPSFSSTVNNDASENTSLSTTTGSSSKIVTTSTQSQSASLTNSGKFGRSVDEIPEFKPGVPWNPNPSTPSFAPSNTRRLSQKSDGNQRPDSIPLTGINSSYSSNSLPSFAESSPDVDYYSDSMSGSYGNIQAPPQQHRRPGMSPAGMGQPNPRFGGNNTGGYYNRQQSGQGFPPRQLPTTPTSQMFPPNHYNPPNSGRNRQRLYSQQSTGGVYNEMGQKNRGYESGRKWSFDGNPWGVPEKSGTSIWSVDSTENLLSPSVGSEMAFSPATEWKAPFRKPSLPVNLSAPTNCIFLNNVPPQVDESSVRDVCSEYGMVQNCILNMFSAKALVFYQSRDDALQAKLGLDKNPYICGVNVQPSFATEKAIASFSSQLTPSHTYSHPHPRMDSASAWLPSDSKISPSTQQPRISSVGSRSPFNAMTPSRQEHNLGIKKEMTSSNWSNEFSAPGGPVMSSGASNSVWSHGGILPGISTPWDGNSTQSNNTNTGPHEGGTEDTSAALAGTSPSMSTFLPNGLF